MAIILSLRINCIIHEGRLQVNSTRRTRTLTGVHACTASPLTPTLLTLLTTHTCLLPSAVLAPHTDIPLVSYNAITRDSTLRAAPIIRINPLHALRRRRRLRR